jgi:hypothetical protein
MQASVRGCAGEEELREHWLAGSETERTRAVHSRLQVREKEGRNREAVALLEDQRKARVAGIPSYRE